MKLERRRYRGPNYPLRVAVLVLLLALGLLWAALHSCQPECGGTPSWTAACQTVKEVTK